MMDEERREFERLIKSASVKYRRLDSLGGYDEMLCATMLDCSGGGIRFSASDSCAKNDQLLVELEFDGWLDIGEEWTWTEKNEDVGVLRAIGVVMWTKKNMGAPDTYEIGVRFTGSIKG